MARRAVHTVLYLLIKQGPEHWQWYEEEENTSHHFNLPNQLFLKENRQKGKVKPKVIQATKYDSYFFLHGSSLLHLLVTLDMFAFLHFSATPKLSIKGQESTDGKGQEHA